MAKIIKVASTTSTPRIANQFKTSRNSTTNPFKYQNFEGNTLDISAFADVFESSSVKETSKIKLIAASVAGSMHKIRSSITEPIVNFVNRVYENISSAWDYAKNTNISEIGIFKGINSGLKSFGEYMSTPVEIPGSHLADSAINGIKGIFSYDFSGWGNELGSKWSALVSKIHSNNKVYSDLSVSELETLWKSELSLQEAA